MSTNRLSVNEQVEQNVSGQRLELKHYHKELGEFVTGRNDEKKVQEASESGEKTH